MKGAQIAQELLEVYGNMRHEEKENLNETQAIESKIGKRKSALITNLKKIEIKNICFYVARYIILICCFHKKVF